MRRIERETMLKLTLAACISATIIFGAYSLVAYSKAPSTTSVSYETVYVEKGSITHSGLFSNETVYKNGSSLDHYPERITRFINVTYSYETEPSAEGSYRAVLRTDYYVVSNKKRVYIKNVSRETWSGGFSGSFSIPVPLNVSRFDSDLKKIRDGTGLFRASGETYLLVRVKIEGRKPFVQRIGVSRDTSGMLSLFGGDKDYKEVRRHSKTTEKRMNFLWSRVSVSTGRKAFPALSAFFAIPPLGFIYSRRGKKLEDELKGLRKFVVEGRPDDRAKSVLLESAGDLERVFNIVDKPIVHHLWEGRDVYSITDGETTYEYIVE
ncbi:hypothetical protein [Thermococcus sp.]|uniref:hypothetical protein n=1 Tax=Thermococcus sp. TaxID=35749 RepID=UPI00261377B0|nr:hypothetical protein [Thermococcus sp.]